MTPLRQRLIEDLQLKGMSERTQEMYVRAVRQLAQHYHKPPDQISDEELRQYFLYVKNVKHWSRSGTTIALCGLKFFYQHTLQRSLTTLQLVRPPREKKLPAVLSREEVRQILSRVRWLRYRTCLTTIYACGLRLQEGTHLQVSDIDSARKLIHVHRGKGGKDRYVPLPDSTLELLRQYWKTHANPVWIFPGGIHRPTAPRPTPLSNVQDAFRLALRQSGISKKASVHTRRHSYATHWLEAGVNLRLIQQYLGHNSAETTSLYTHLTSKAQEMATAVIHRLMEGL